jgi:hypothetical protein
MGTKDKTDTAAKDINGRGAEPVDMAASANKVAVKTKPDTAKKTAVKTKPDTAKKTAVKTKPDTAKKTAVKAKLDSVKAAVGKTVGKAKRQPKK